MMMMMMSRKNNKNCVWTSAMFVVLVLLICGIPLSHSAIHVRGIEGKSEKSEIQDLSERLKRLNGDVLARVLRDVGVGNYTMREEESDEKSEHHETHLAKQCETVVMYTTTKGENIGKHEGMDIEEALKNGEISMIEVDSEMSASEETLGGDIDANLECECDTYKCQCRKMCFCQLQEAQYGGNVVPAMSKDGDEPKGSGIVDSQFKCTCAFESAPGTGALAGGTMDCDCKIADCACEKQCKCKMKK